MPVIPKPGDFVLYGDCIGRVRQIEYMSGIPWIKLENKYMKASVLMPLYRMTHVIPQNIMPGDFVQQFIPENDFFPRILTDNDKHNILSTAASIIQSHIKDKLYAPPHGIIYLKLKAKWDVWSDVE